MAGLGKSYWSEVIAVLRTIIPVYDRVNYVISLGKANQYRRKGIQDNICPNDIVLDAGSGYGNMSKLALNESRDLARIVLYDPISEMLKSASEFLNPKLNQYLFSGVFEFMPFKNNTFDVVMCGYSLRDSIELHAAVAEIHRVLKQEGRLIIVDIGKPDNSILRAGVTFYLKYVLGILAFAAAGRSGLKFKTLYGTYLRWPQNSDLYILLSQRFRKIEYITKLLGGAIIVAAYK